MSPETEEFTPADNRSYALGVIRKQRPQLNAEQTLEQLGAEKVDALVAAGRSADLATVRAILDAAN